MYTVDGLPPEGDGWLQLITGSGLRGFSGRRGAALEIPGMDGSFPDTRAPLMSGTLPLRYRIFTADHAKAMQTLELFNGIFGQNKLLPVTHDYGNGTTRVNNAVVIQTVVPEVENVNLAYYTATLDFPSPLWRSPTVQTVSSPTLTASLATFTLSGLVGRAPISDALIRFNGGFASAEIRDPVSGDVVTVQTPASTTEYIIVDCANWTARRVTTDTWTGGTDVSHLVQSNRGQGVMLSFAPDQIITGGRYRASALALNPSGTPTVEVRAHAAFH